MVTEQDTNVSENEMEGFAEGFSFEYANEEQAAEQDTNAEVAQEGEAGQSGEEEDTHSTEQSGAEETTKEDPKPETEEKIEVSFLGEKKQLTKEEAVSYAQKGMNYDHLEKQLNESRTQLARLEAELSAPRAETAVMPLVKAYAQSMGMNMQEFTQSMMQAVKDANLRIDAPQQRNYMQEKAVRDWQDFMTAYPDIRDPKTELPKEVWDAIKGGLTPRMALVEYKQRDFESKLAEKDAVIAERDNEISTLKQQIETMQLNAKNKQKAAGSVKSTVESAKQNDFLNAFLNS